MTIEFEVTNNSKETLAEFEKACVKALTAVGLEAEGNAIDKVTDVVYGSPPSDWYVRTGQLKNSIHNEVNEGEKEVEIGSSLEYAIYVECGTGRYYDKGGRPDGWVYTGSDGKTHFTRGMKARPFFKPAIADNVDQYKEIIKNNLKG